LSAKASEVVFGISKSSIKPKPPDPQRGNFHGALIY
jgi:hypothetical protein